MKKCLVLLLMLTLLLSALAGCAKEKEKKGPEPVEIAKSAGNPIAGFDGEGNLIYGGDPSVLVVDDTAYLYVGHDVSTNDAYNIPEYMCYSTKDLQTWTYEGVILSMKDVSWGTADAAWAGQCARHTDPATGKDMYYFYFCSWDKTDSGKQSIGVAVSESPTGPFVDIGEPIVKGSFTTGQTSDWNDIDPTVWIETGEDGEEHRYLCWGNGKVYICELNEDMVSVKDYDGDGEIKFGRDIRDKQVPSAFTEAPWLYRRRDENGNSYGFYYLFYAHNWREDMSYAILDGDDIMKDDFYFESRIMEASATSNTNHMAVFDFLGKTWFIYHNGSLPNGSGFRRVACIEELHFDDDGYIDTLTESAAGPFGTVSTLTSGKGDLLQHAHFNNSYADNDYPYTAVALGSGLEGAVELDGQWVIRQGKADASDVYAVSIESQNKAGLYITVTDAGAVLSQDWDGNQAQAQTFRTITGLSGSGVSFESVARPGQYLTLSGGTLTLTDGQDAEAASFNIGTAE